MGDATLNDLLTDTAAQIEILVNGNYRDELGVVHSFWGSTLGWDDDPEGPVASYIKPLVELKLKVDHNVDPLNLSSSNFGAFAEINLLNNTLWYPGEFDAWWKYSVDDLEWRIYAVGILSKGERVEISDVIDTPIARLKGVDGPEVGSDVCRIVTQDYLTLDKTLQPETFSPPSPLFPGLLTAAGAIDLGDVLDITGSCARSVWFYIDNPALSTVQFLFFKDSVTAGYYLNVGLVGTGTIVGGVEIVIRGQTPVQSLSVAGVLRAGWHRMDLSIDLAAGTRRVDLDGTSVINISGVTGTPLGNSQSLLIGYGLSGSMSRFLAWSGARSNATMSAEGRIPITGAESNLDAYYPLNEGSADTVFDLKSGSVLTGTLGASVSWDSNAAWHYSSLSGQHIPLILGTVPRAQLVWIDPPKQIAQVSHGSVAIISEVQQNHAAISTGIYTANKSNSTITITSGALAGTYSATVTANNFWNSAIQSISTSTGLATINSVNGSVTMGIQYTPSRSQSGASLVLMGWQTSASAGSFILRLKSTGGANRLEAFTVTNSGTIIILDSGFNLIEGRTYSIAVKRDISGTGTLSIHVDGEQVLSIGMSSGVFTTTRTAFGIMCRPDATANTQPLGRFDEPWVIARAISQDEIRALHLLPATGSEPNLTYLWHLDEATGTSAASALGGTALTLANITWVGGRTAAADLARWCYYQMGYVAADLHEASWRSCLNKNPADCGWNVLGGQITREVINILLGGLGFVAYPWLGVIKIARFEALTGTPAMTYDPDIYRQNAAIEPGDCDPAVYEWIILYATNNTKQDKANIAQSLATTDPDRFEYGAKENKRALRSRYSVKDDFPNAISKPRLTALINELDAVAEAYRLIPIHAAGSDTKVVQMLLLPGAVEILSENALIADLAQGNELELETTTLRFIGIVIEDNLATITIWRPRR